MVVMTGLLIQNIIAQSSEDLAKGTKLFQRIFLNFEIDTCSTDQTGMHLGSEREVYK